MFTKNHIPKGDASKESSVSTRARLWICAVAGLLFAVFTGIFFEWRFTPLAFWDSAATLFLIWIWVDLRGRDAEQTANLAVREDPGRTLSDTLLTFASLASLAAVGVLLTQASGSGKVGELTLVAVGIVSVVISWAVVHAVYTLRYARMFYASRGGIDFNSNQPPRFSDFAYIAFTIGMTFQVSDTSFQTNEFRRAALRHTLLSYVFGTVIVASAINLIAGLVR